MRPYDLNQLFSGAKSLDGIGPRLLKLLEKLLDKGEEAGGPRVLDLLWHMPTGIVDRRARPKIAEAMPGALATFEVRVLKHKAPPGRNSKAPYRINCEDDTGRLDLIFFRGEKKYLEAQLPVGQTRFVSGRVERYGDQLQMPHPDYIVSPEELDTLPLLEPIYPLTAGLSGKVIRKAIIQAATLVPDLPEWQDAAWLKKNKWPSFAQALKLVHAPEAERDISTSGEVRMRLAYDEILSNQLSLALIRKQSKDIPGRVLKGTGEISVKIRAALPFKLTKSQEGSLHEINADLARPSRMLRLLQGDVGSGKTVVALLAMATAIEAGGQAALMVPTEVLARQHAKTLIPLCDAAGLKVELLTGREKGRARKDLMGRLESGDIDILVGTHALFQKDVVFRDLAFAVIDEQHRFGVHQRLALQMKGGDAGSDVLVMTATPIPRTLLLTHYGDMEVSKLTEKPAGRKPIKTALVSQERMEDVFSGFKRALNTGTQIYWVCPLVESSEKIDLAAAEERHAHLKKWFGDQVGLVHGQMKGPDKDAVMKAFSEGDLSILVATTVIEVGVDVPNATIMVIEHAERFGLAQLHQLRGRVGRGDKQSSCILLYSPPLGATAKARLNIMRDTEDGFIIAEEDLKLRGGGEVLGTRQSGEQEFRLAQVPDFKDLLETAQDDAKLILETDPGLASERGKALRTLLYLFGYEEAVKLFQAG